MFGNGVEKCHCLQWVAACAGAADIGNAPCVNGCLHRTNNQLHAHFGNAAIAKLDDFGEVVPGINVHHREGDARWGECANCQVQHDDRILAARKQQDWALKFGRNFPDDGDRFVNQATQRRLHASQTTPMSIGPAVKLA